MAGFFSKIFGSNTPKDENTSLVIGAQRDFENRQFAKAAATSRKVLNSLESSSQRPSEQVVEIRRTAYICLGMSSFHERKYAEAEEALSEAITITWAFYAASQTPQQLLDNLAYLIQLEMQRLPSLIPQDKWKLHDEYMSELLRARIDTAVAVPFPHRMNVLLALIEDLQTCAWNSLMNPDETRSLHYCSLAFQLMKQIKELDEDVLSSHQEKINSRSDSVVKQLFAISDREELAKSFGLSSSDEITRHLKLKANEQAKEDTGLMYFAELDVRRPTATTSSPGGEKDPIAQIERLSELAARGVLTQEEFLSKKSELLKQI